MKTYCTICTVYTNVLTLYCTKYSTCTYRLQYCTPPVCTKPGTSEGKTTVGHRRKPLRFPLTKPTESAFVTSTNCAYLHTVLGKSTVYSIQYKYSDTVQAFRTVLDSYCNFDFFSLPRYYHTYCTAPYIEYCTTVYHFGL